MGLTARNSITLGVVLSALNSIVKISSSMVSQAEYYIYQR
jgi:hypothetical protein